ncbi:uracil-DNA glycosylase [Flavobacterium jejuense]|uniref:Uracil-DNA glycosylase n=1 Tax=Flavobacterium jejuense TaxID=1544455 RepID=A0ABX0IUJ4_9FLAO|nr:uracil-DNA glycosylase [Flavobacterium jejuense]NHN26815.1 uracil-DNA glycosylase [Flavobacterium jejuense]
MFLKIEASWQTHLQNELEKDYFKALLQNIETEYTTYECFPPKELIFNAFKECSFDDIKIVILGQDPYHGTGEANGLAFSVNDTVKIPPSLRNIYREINTDFDTIFEPNSGNLERWAQQGVLLLNATLTVRKDTPNSHKHLHWQQFTDKVIEIVSNEKEHLVFLLWGAFAQKKAKFIDETKHLILTSGHPSPMSANQGKWFGNKHFSKTNAYLKSIGKQEINW